MFFFAAKRLQADRMVTTAERSWIRAFLRLATLRHALQDLPMDWILIAATTSLSRWDFSSISFILAVKRLQARWIVNAAKYS